MTARWPARSKIARIVGAVAPTVATALGGPLAGVATRAIGEKLLGRSDATETDIEAAVLGASPADLVKLKDLELEFERDMAEAGVRLEEVAAADRASARDREVRTGDRAPAILGGAIVVGFFGVLVAMMFFEVPESAGPAFLILLGALSTMTAQIGNYYFGSSAGSKQKNSTIAAAVEAKRT